MRVVNSLGQYLVLTGAGGGGGTTFSAGISTGGNTLGNTGIVTNQLVFAGINGVTLSGSTVAGGSATISISGITQSSQAAINALGVSDTGNTAGNTGTSSGITWVLAGSNANTLSQSTAGGGPNTVWIQGPISATTISAVSAANVVGTRGSRFALEDHQHAGVFSAGASNVGVTAGNTTVVPGRFVFAGSGAVTVSQETAANSLNTLHIQGPVSATTISGVQSANSIGTRGTRFALEDHFHQGLAQFQISGNTSNTSNTVVGSLVLAGGNNITLSQVSAAGAATVTISAAAQTNQQMTMFATGNTTLSSTGTTNASSMIFLGSGAASVGITGGSILIDVAAGAAAITQSFGISTQTAGGATAGTSGYATGDDILYHFVPGSNITMSQSLNGASATLSIYGPAAGGGATISSYENMPGGLWGTSAVTFGATSLSSAVAFMMPQAGSFSFIRIPVLMTMASTTIATIASATATAQMGQSSTYNVVVYSVGVGASSRSLISVASGSDTWNLSARISITNSTQYSVSLAFSGNVEGGGTTLTTQYSISNTNYSFTTNQYTAFSSNRMLDIAFANSLSAGAYWVVIGRSTSSSSGGAGLTAMTSWGPRYSNHYAGTQGSLAFGIMGSTNMTSIGGAIGAGVFSTAGGGTTSALPISAISSTASNPRMYFQLLRSA